MLDENTQLSIYHPLKWHLGLQDDTNTPLPELVIENDECKCKLRINDLFDQENKIESINDLFEHENKIKINQWFDLLGWFDSSEANRNKVYLCEPLIKKCATNLKCDEHSLTQLIYAHELAHYFHFNINQNGWEQYRKRSISPFSDLFVYYVESFAQLCTHAIARNLDSFGNNHLIILENLTERSPAPYKYYKDKGLTTMAREVIIEFYLNCNSISEDIQATLEDSQEEFINKILKSNDCENDKEYSLMRDLGSIGFPEEQMLINLLYEPFQNMKYLVPRSYRGSTY